MRKNLYSFLIIAVCVSCGFSQTIKTEKAKLTETQKLELKREKFDPARSSAQDLETAIIKAKKEKKRMSSLRTLGQREGRHAQ